MSEQLELFPDLQLTDLHDWYVKKYESGREEVMCKRCGMTKPYWEWKAAGYPTHKWDYFI